MDYRCRKCHKLLFKVTIMGGRVEDIQKKVMVNTSLDRKQVEAKCPKCKHITLYPFEELDKSCSLIN